MVRYIFENPKKSISYYLGKQWVVCMPGESLCMQYVQSRPCVPLHAAAGTGRREIAKYNIVAAYREVVVKNLENNPELDACEILYERICAMFLFAVSGARSFRTPTKEAARKFCYYFHLALYTTPECTHIILYGVIIIKRTLLLPRSIPDDAGYLFYSRRRINDNISVAADKYDIKRKPNTQ